MSGVEYTIVQIRSGCAAGELTAGRGLVICTAVDETTGCKVEWRTNERPQLGDRVSCVIATVHEVP